MIAYETGVANTVDPLGGAYEIEEQTGRIESGAEDYLWRIDGMGGMLRAIETGFVQQEIQNAAYDYQQAVESGRQVVVGVNRFQTDAPPLPAQKIDPNLERAQVERLRRVRRERNAAAVERALAEVERAAAGTENLLTHILHAVEAHATVGEISDAMRRVFGEYRETVVV